VIQMLPWLSNGVLRYAIILSLGWFSLAVVVAATSGAVSRDETTEAPRPSKAIKLDQLDPCTRDPIALDVRLFVAPFARVDGDFIYIDLLVTLNGYMQAGQNRTERRVAIVDHFSVTRTRLLGLLEPVEVLLRLLERPTLPDTLLAVRLQPFWDGSNETIAVTDTHLTCE
jgi:hypothetical protein